MGHATRIIPVVQNLLNADYEVVIGVTESNSSILKEEFPELKKILIPGYNIKYSKRNSQIFKVLMSVPRIIFSVFRENQVFRKINKTEKFDAVISDNRYGLRNKKTYNIFISHQLFIKVPKKVKFAEKFIHLINRYLINKFDELWIPDNKSKENLSGELSHLSEIHKNQHFIGLLSRFSETVKFEINKKFDILFILSGPEPQRSIFEKIVAEQILKSEFSALIVAAKPNLNFENKLNSRIKMVSHLASAEMQKAILSSEFIISRSGYTTLMDLVSIKKSAILVPTPGQPEQEYLADYMISKNLFYCVKQSNFDLEESILNLKKLSSENIRYFDVDNSELINCIKNIKNKIYAE